MSEKHYFYQDLDPGRLQPGRLPKIELCNMSDEPRTVLGGVFSRTAPP